MTGIRLLLALALTCFFTIVTGQEKAQIISEDVTIQSKDKLFKLAGTFSLPGGKGKYPAVILVWGNGPHTRQMNISGTPVFDQLSEFFLKQGIAVLRSDKRGIGLSTGPYSGSEDSSTTADLTDDIECWYKYLLSRREIDKSNIGIYGHSEGAIIAPMLAAREKGIKWLIMLAPTAVPGNEVVVKQRRLNASKLGIRGDTLDAVMNQFDRLFRFIKTRDFRNQDSFYVIGHDFLVAHGVRESDITKKFIDQLLSGFVNDWNHYFFNLDPAKYISQVNVPMLAIFSAADEQVFLGQNLLPFAKASGISNNNDVMISVLPDEDHFFLRHEGKRLTKHKPGEMKVSEALLKTMQRWLQTRVVN